MTWEERWKRAPKGERARLYAESASPFFNEKGLFSDGTKDYVIPPEPEKNSEVTIRLRVLKNQAEQVELDAGEDGIFPMTRQETKGEFDYYHALVPIGEKPISYLFRIIHRRGECFYHRLGMAQEPERNYAFRLIPGFHVPEWMKGAVIYQIFTDRFYNGDPGNDVVTGEYAYLGGHAEKVEDWSQYPSSFDVRQFYGGDLAGVLEKLSYLEELGVEVIYFNPLFVSPSNHKYDTQDYDNIDPHYGCIIEDSQEVMASWDGDNTHAGRYSKRVTSQENLKASNALFAKVVEEAHKRNIRVIMDGVFNHCGSFNKWMDRERIYENAPGYAPGAYISKESPYRDYFSFAEDQWPYNSTYDGWWGHDTLPKLNYEGSKNLFQYMMTIGKKWVSAPYGADGWRLDVAADLGHSLEYNHLFWREFRKNVKEANPQAVILAEHYGDATDWLQGDQWDTVMNYDAFMEPVSWFLTGMEKHSDERKGNLEGQYQSFLDAMRYNGLRFTTGSLQAAMNELSNHDHSRFLTRTNKTVGRIQFNGPEAAEQGIHKEVFRLAVLLQFTWPGAPTIYYGDEVGVCGFTDPDNRRTYPWGKEDMALLDYHRGLIALHKNSPALRTGSLLPLAGENKIMAYGRFNQEEQWIVICSLRSEECTYSVPVWPTGIPREAVLRRRLLTQDDTYSFEETNEQVSKGILTIQVPPKGGILLQYQGEKHGGIWK